MDTQILLSVIIPSHNRCQELSETIHSLLNQTKQHYPYEIIVIDNNSTDQTRQVVNEISILTKIPIRYFFESQPGLHHGRHLGAREAKGEILAYLDDDILITPGWESGARLILEGRAQAVAGRILPEWEIPPPDWLKQLITSNVFGYLTLLDLGWFAVPVPAHFVWGANFFVKKSLVFTLKGFHPDSLPQGMEQFRGDGESGFFRKFAQAGYSAWYDPSATVFHRVSTKRMSLDYLYRRAYLQGISNSFTMTRQQNGLYHPDSDEFRSLFQQTRKIMRNIKKKIFPPKNHGILKHLLEHEQKGFAYHQECLRQDPSLLQYVLRDNYL